MNNLQNFIGPVKTKAMKVQAIDKNGQIVKTFDVPEGFQLERYVDSLYPEEEFMIYATAQEINISILGENDIIEIYRGVYL